MDQIKYPEVNSKNMPIKQNIFINKLIENKNGVSIDDFMKILNCSRKGVTETVHRVRNSFSQYTIIRSRNKYMILVNEQTELFNNANISKQEEFYNLLKENPDGISINEIKDKLDFENKDISNKIYALKSKGIYIERKDRICKLLNEKPIEKTEIIHTKTEAIIKPSILPVQYKNKLKNLNQSDLNDVIDMLKKAYYYQKSAIALIEANEITDEFINLIS